MDPDALALMTAYNTRTPLRALLTERRLAHDLPGWKREAVSRYEINAMQGDTEWLARFSQVYIGGESVTVRDEKTRYIDQAVWPCTNGELAREYLSLVLGAKRKVAHRPKYFKRTAPLYCEPHHGNLAYVDLRHAYFEIVRHFDPETCFVDPGTKGQHFVIPTGPRAWYSDDEIDDDRRLRHALTGILFSKGISYFNHGELRLIPLFRGHHRPSLYRITMDMLHAIALDVSRHFTLWAWLTDAAIVNENEADDLQAFLLARWAFPSTLKARGRGSIYHLGSYRIGEEHDPLSRWTEDQRGAKGPRESRVVHRIGKLNVTWWRKEREQCLNA